MREDDREKVGEDDASSGSGEKKRARRSRSYRNGGGFGPGFSQGMGGNPFGGFNPGQILQMLPLMMAMGGGMPGAGMAQMQLRLMMWALETWLDYLSAMQEVFERALDRLRDMEVMGGFAGGGEEHGEGGKDW